MILGGRPCEAFSLASQRNPFDPSARCILRCTLCGCYFHSWEEYEERFLRLLPRYGSFKRLKRNRVFDLFPDRKKLGLFTGHKCRKIEMWKHSYLLCNEDLESIYGNDKLKKGVEALEKEIGELKR